MIIEFKNDLGINQSQLAKMLGIERAFVSRCYIGERKFSDIRKEQMKNIFKSIQLIKQNPADVLLLKHEFVNYIESIGGEIPKEVYAQIDC